jgi:hypothetical protein
VRCRQAACEGALALWQLARHSRHAHQHGLRASRPLSLPSRTQRETFMAGPLQRSGAASELGQLVSQSAHPRNPATSAETQAAAGRQGCRSLPRFEPEVCRWHGRACPEADAPGFGSTPRLAKERAIKVRMHGHALMPRTIPAHFFPATEFRP